MDPFALQQGCSGELEMFPHIIDFSLVKNNTIQLDSFPTSVSDYLRIYYVVDGKFDWIINCRHQFLYPGDVAVIMPGQELGGTKGLLDIGTLLRLYVRVENMTCPGGMKLGKWSKLEDSERISLTKILNNGISLLKMEEVGNILQEMSVELLNQEVGYLARVNHLLDTLLIMIARQFTKQLNSRTDFSRTFANIEQELRKNLGHQWKLCEMAAIAGLGTTAFTEKVKAHTGFSPLNYLINIRIAEAIKLLKKPDISVTNIALETGFYSSQHFSTTFKKLTGYTPKDFRKRNSSLVEHQ